MADVFRPARGRYSITKIFEINVKIKVLLSRTREEAVVLVAARRESEAEAVAECLRGAGGGAAGEGGDGDDVPHGGAVVLVARPLLRVAPATTLPSGQQQQYVDSRYVLRLHLYCLTMECHYLSI